MMKTLLWGNDVALPAHDDVTAPGGGLWSTAEDMAIWLRYQLGLIPSTSPALTELDALLPALQTAVFVFVNRDGSDPGVEDPSDVLRTELGEPLLEQFP